MAGGVPVESPTDQDGGGDGDARHSWIM